MADGAIQGIRRAIGQVAHTDGNATVVVALALPTAFDGYYHVHARVENVGATGVSPVYVELHGVVRVDGGALNVQSATIQSTDSATGYTATLAVSGANVQVTVTAANARRSCAYIEAFGVEMALTIG